MHEEGSPIEEDRTVFTKFLLCFEVVNACAGRFWLMPIFCLIEACELRSLSMHQLERMPLGLNMDLNYCTVYVGHNVWGLATSPYDVQGSRNTKMSWVSWNSKVRSLNLNCGILQSGFHTHKLNLYTNCWYIIPNLLGSSIIQVCQENKASAISSI